MMTLGCTCQNTAFCHTIFQQQKQKNNKEITRILIGKGHASVIFNKIEDVAKLENLLEGIILWLKRMVGKNLPTHCIR